MAKGNRGGTGRPRKPTHLHVLEGTYRPDRHKQRLEEEPPVDSDGSLPPPPKGLEKDVHAAWAELRENVKHRIYSKDDIAAFGAFASMWATWNKCNRSIHREGIAEESTGKDGRTTRVLSPEARLWMDLNGKLLAYFARFGMTPADRSRVKVVKGDKDAHKQENPDDEFAQG